MVFLLRQSMAQIPKELNEAAIVDGASHIQIWWEIVLPLVKAPLATVATFLFVGFWNSLLTPSDVSSDGGSLHITSLHHHFI